MGYYMRGDYATGGYGYASGDPGFLSSFWKGVKKFVLPAAATLIGGPVAGGIVRAGMGRGTPPLLPMSQRSQPQQQLGVRVGPMQFSSTDFYPPVPRFGGARAPSTTAHERMAMASAGAGCCPVGFHLDKQTGVLSVFGSRPSSSESNWAARLLQAQWSEQR